MKRDLLLSILVLAVALACATGCKSVDELGPDSGNTETATVPDIDGGPDVDGDGDTDTDGDTDGDSDSDSDGDTDGDSDADGDTDTDTDSDTDSDTDADGDTDADADSDTALDTDTCGFGYEWNGSECVEVNQPPGLVVNGDFEDGTSGWILEGGCQSASKVVTDNAAHHHAFGMYLAGGTSCTSTVFYQVVAIPPMSSLRIRVDFKMMRYSDAYTGPVYLRVSTGTSSPYNQHLVGQHKFDVGTTGNDPSLDGTSKFPLGLWGSYTSEDIMALDTFPAGSEFLRLEFRIAGHGVYGWARLDNIALVKDDAEMPEATVTPDPPGGGVPVSIAFDTTCPTECSGISGQDYTWDFGDGPTADTATGGGGTAFVPDPIYEYKTPVSYASLVVADAAGGTTTVLIPLSVTPNKAPVVSITCNGAGPAPLTVTFTGNCSDPDGTCASFSWDFGDGGSSKEQDPVHVYADPGNYKAIFTATDNSGKKSSAETIIIVY